MMEPEVIPAILVKTREELLDRIKKVHGHVKEIQLDIMDGMFVPNKTIGLESLHDLPKENYELHWMVKDPENWIEKVPGPYMHLVHVETITDFSRIEEAVKKAGGQLGLAINPETPIEKLLPYAEKAKRILVMTVKPGFSGQKYIHGMGDRIKKLREMLPSLDIEVDGGVNLDTASHAYSHGANILAAASAIFKAESIEGAIDQMKTRAKEATQ